MRINLDTFEEVHSPMYVVEEAKLRRNLELIVSVATRADVEIILLKLSPYGKLFPSLKSTFVLQLLARSLKPNWPSKSLVRGRTPILQLTQTMR